MAKILEVTPETVSIGMDDGSIREVPADSLNFVPHVGDKVETFESVNRVIVSKLEEVRQTLPQQPAQQTPIIINNTNSNVNTNVNYAHGGTPKNKWTALLLCLFLGVIGAHKFYEGKVGMGVLYLLTLGLAGFGVVIDFFVLLFKPTTYYV